MKDSDIRGVVLRKFYDLRKDNCYHQLEESDLGQIDNEDYNRIGSQLEQKGLIEWYGSISNDGGGRITAYGVDVIEGDVSPPLLINLVDKVITIGRDYTGQINALNEVADHLRNLKDRFKKSDQFGYFLDTEDQSLFRTIVVEARTLLAEALGGNDDFQRQLGATLLSDTRSALGGPSKACVAEIEQLLRGAVRAVVRKQQAIPADTVKESSKPPYVNPARIAELQNLPRHAWDYSKLIQLCGELNKANEHECHYAVAMLVRAITDHVPPLFGVAKFGEVVANYKGSRSFKETITGLDIALRKIADGFLHQQIRRKETTPNDTQVNFSQSLDTLLGEVVRIA